MGKGKVKVNSVVENDGSNPSNPAPILVRFEHADVNPNMDGSLDLNQIFGAAVFQSDTGTSTSRDMSHLTRPANTNRSRMSGQDSRGTKRKQVVALQSDAMTYIGTKGFNNLSLPSATDDLMKTFVALRQNKRLRIFEVTPITVSPYLEGHSHVVEKPRVQVEKSKEEKREATVDLVKAFGSKKKRLAYERMEKNKIDITDMEESINSAVNKLEVPDAEPTIKDESILGLIPPCNRAAAMPQEVYQLDDILTKDELNAMDELADYFLSVSRKDIKKWKESKRHSDYFFAMWNKLQSTKDDPRTINTAKVVLYTELLIKFLKLSYNQIRKKQLEISEDFPLWMKDKVGENFSSVNSHGIRNRSEAHKDKICCYIMVLVLLANEYFFDVQLMSTSLNIHIKKLLTLAKAVGITVTQNAAKQHRGILKVPLPRPIETRGRRRTMR
ncbi:DNA-directed RNA polymerase I subunit RPA49 [Orchesella cincta]|uniref:DNA-directed RNA polymerase I subunit RPA49 n=1 Tax=Orchesella cincta TaxID=48709 RepID=A0A1D2NAS9_ORCCI|nr:DNA-directed RNA polymerase I subunit RPA49 [Orchesella cincta]